MRRPTYPCTKRRIGHRPGTTVLWYRFGAARAHHTCSRSRPAYPLGITCASCVAPERLGAHQSACTSAGWMEAVSAGTGCRRCVRRSRRQVRHPRRSATCGPLARRPGRIACRSRGTWVRGETQRTAPMPTAEGGRRWEGSNGAHIVKLSKKMRSGKRVVRRAADPEHQLRSRDSIDAPLSEAATGAA